MGDATAEHATKSTECKVPALQGIIQPLTREYMKALQENLSH